MKMVIIFKNVNFKVKKVFNYFYKRKHSKTLVQSLERPKILFSLNTVYLLKISRQQHSRGGLL